MNIGKQNELNTMLCSMILQLSSQKIAALSGFSLAKYYFELLSLHEINKHVKKYAPCFLAHSNEFHRHLHGDIIASHRIASQTKAFAEIRISMRLQNARGQKKRIFARHSITLRFTLKRLPPFWWRVYACAHFRDHCTHIAFHFIWVIIHIWHEISSLRCNSIWHSRYILLIPFRYVLNAWCANERRQTFFFSFFLVKEYIAFCFSACSIVICDMAFALCLRASEIHLHTCIRNRANKTYYYSIG